MADSLEEMCAELIIIGMKDSKFNSRPIHIPIQEEEDNVIKVPLIRVEIKINFEI
jgi:hypothetical protein